MVESYLGGSVLKEEMEEALFDLEIGFIHRYIFVLLCKHLDVKGESLEETELVEKGEKLVKALERRDLSLEQGAEVEEPLNGRCTKGWDLDER